MISTRDHRAETTRFGNRQGKHDAGRLSRLQTTLLVPPVKLEPMLIYMGFFC